MIVNIFGHAANAVAAHLRLAAIGVVHAHTRVGLVGRTDKDQAIAADAEMAVADSATESGRIVRHRIPEAIDVDVIVPAALHFREAHRISSLPVLQGSAVVLASLLSELGSDTPSG